MHVPAVIFHCIYVPVCMFPRMKSWIEYQPCVARYTVMRLYIVSFLGYTYQVYWKRSKFGGGRGIAHSSFLRYISVYRYFGISLKGLNVQRIFKLVLRVRYITPGYWVSELHVNTFWTYTKLISPLYGIHPNSKKVLIIASSLIWNGDLGCWFSKICFVIQSSHRPLPPFLECRNYIAVCCSH